MHNDYTDAILRSLVDAEYDLADANMRMSEARIAFNVAAIKYAALRDAAWEQLGGGPHRLAEWPGGTVPTGDFRFVRANPTDAILEALLEGGEPLTLLGIASALRKGGLRVPPRTINAVLQGHGNIRRAGDQEPALYEASMPEVDPDDLPF